MKYNLMTFKDVDWSFVDHVEDADLRFKTVTVIMKNGNKFTVSLPKELFDQWYNETYGFGFSAVQQGIVLVLMIICVGAIIGFAIYSSVH